MNTRWFRCMAGVGLALLLLTAPMIKATAQSPRLVHGLWVWKSPEVLHAPQGAERLRDFCKAQGINEVYVSYSAATAGGEEEDFKHLIGLMHRADIRVEALLSSTDADEPGKHRDKLLDRARQVVEFNRSHPNNRFDGIHLDIEPQQRPENKGPGNLRFLPGLAEAFRAVRAVAEPAGLTVNADIQNKLLKGDASQRRMLLSAVSRVTLMMYELSSPGDGQTPAQQAEKAAESSEKFLAMAYDGLRERNLARMAIALRTPDYGELLPQMLKKLDATDLGNPHYLGWARHAYNDTLQSQ
ncbi:MAG: hypothetical protein WBV28_04970 [Terracidiphilus sp.]